MPPAPSLITARKLKAAVQDPKAAKIMRDAKNTKAAQKPKANAAKAKWKAARDRAPKLNKGYEA